VPDKGVVATDVLVFPSSARVLERSRYSRDIPFALKAQVSLVTVGIRYNAIATCPVLFVVQVYIVVRRASDARAVEEAPLALIVEECTGKFTHPIDVALVELIGLTDTVTTELTCHFPILGMC